ncbi:MAG: hypothetical protein ACXWHZ_03685 [Usitatibacter sp.]
MWNVQEQEERDFVVSSEAECDAAYAREIGAHQPERAWILSDRDVWYRNPAYRGPAVPHPESDDYADDESVERPSECYSGERLPSASPGY